MQRWMMTALRASAFGFAALLVSAGCEEKGPMEKAGESVDKGVDKAVDAVNPKGPLEKAGEKVDNAVNP